MKLIQTGVLGASEMFFSTPSQRAKSIYFYPICAGRFFCGKDYRVVRERYDSLLITHILDGKLVYVEDGQHITAQKGDTVVINCYEPHEYYAQDYAETLWVHVCGSNALSLYEEIENNGGSLVKCKDTRRTCELLFRILDGVKRESLVSEVETSLNIYKLLSCLLCPVSIKTDEESTYEECIRQVKEYINNNLDGDLHVKHLAELAHMSPSHFSRVFKGQTGFAPYDFVLISRLNMAKHLLQNTDKTVYEIAYRVGFNSESNFIYFFKENAGISPGRFRKLTF